MLERKVNYNPAFPVLPDPQEKQFISNNYYPVTSAIAMRDEKLHRQVTIMPDRTQGGSASLINNTIELM